MPLPDALERLSQEHIDMRVMLSQIEREIEVIAQYRDPDAETIPRAIRYFVDYPAQRHHPVENMIFEFLKTRVPEDLGGIDCIADHADLELRIGEFALMTRNLFLDPPKWRMPFCETGRNFVTAKRRHIRAEETYLFPLSLQHLTEENWVTVENLARRAAEG